MRIGDEVRDRAGLRGFIIERDRKRALVAWAVGYTTWIRTKWLTVQNSTQE